MVVRGGEIGSWSVGRLAMVADSAMVGRMVSDGRMEMWCLRCFPVVGRLSSYGGGTGEEEGVMHCQLSNPPAHPPGALVD